MDTKSINKVSTKLYRSEYQPHEDWGKESENFCNLITALRLNNEATTEIITSAIRMVNYCQRHAFKFGFAQGVKYAEAVQTNAAEESEA